MSAKPTIAQESESNQPFPGHASNASWPRPACLLLVPRTLYHYPGVFAATLEDMGYAVTSANDEYPDSPIGKAIGKLDLGLSRWWTRQIVVRRFLTRQTWDLILIVKGRGVGPKLVAEMRKSAKRIVGYHYDSLRFDPATRRWTETVDRVSTFDYSDARAEGWPLVELFSAAHSPESRPPAAFTLCAVLRNHSQRLAYVDRVLGALGNPPSFVYFYEKDCLTRLINFVRNPRCYWKWRRHIHRRPLPYNRYVQILSQSEFAVDFAHPKQTGATMRSIEALAIGTKLITNNRFLTQSARFSQACPVFFAIDADPAELRRQVALNNGCRQQTRWRSPREFMAEVIGTID